MRLDILESVPESGNDNLVSKSHVEKLQNLIDKRISELRVEIDEKF